MVRLHDPLSIAWQDYWQTAVEEIDETEDRVDRTWQKVLAALLLWELWLRRRTVRRAFELPTVDGGWIDTGRRELLRRFRAQVRRDAGTAASALQRELGGGFDPLGFSPGTRPPRNGITPQAIGETIEGVRINWEALDEMRRRVEEELAKPLPATMTPQFPPVPPGPEPREAITPERLREIEQALEDQPGQPDRRRARELEDELEIGQDALINIARNLGYEFDRVTETIVRLSGRFSRPSDIADYLDGTPAGTRTRASTGQPWQVNRNNLRLSSTAHIRAAHRRRMISEATAAGVTHFRLDVPTRRLDLLTPSSVIGEEVWQIRTLQDWQDVASRLNRGRIAASGFDTLGLGYGDFTYVVPVPKVFLAEAEAQSRKWRRRLAASGALLIAN